MSGPEAAKAAEVHQPLPELTMPKFINSAGHIDLQIDLNKGTARIESDADITTVNTVVNHPAPSVKPKVIKIPVYETKTEYLTKVVTFPLSTPKLHISSISIPNRIER